MANMESPAQKATIARVMHEAKHGELKTSAGQKVKNPKQAIAIALHEAGASHQASPAENKKTLKKTKANESRGATGQAQAEGKKQTRK
jgi:hypothetical protein